MLSKIFRIVVILCVENFTSGSWVLVTGGTGYIGSHTCVELIRAGENVVVVDNLSNSVKESLVRVIEITGCGKKQIKFRKVDLLEKAKLRNIFEEFEIESVIHLAGIKSVSESHRTPLKYYENNVGGTINLVEVMLEFGVKNLVFSSSATVYGTPTVLPLTESCAAGESIASPYGRTKFVIEGVLKDVQRSYPSFNVIVLRYFNPIGAHGSGKLGEDPNGVPNNLMPYISQVAVGRQPYLNVYGNDYNTKDGTGVRDYLHVVDLAEGHILAVNKLRKSSVGFSVVNLGTGKGYTVFEILHKMEEVSGRNLPYQIKPRRPGDIDSLYADPSFAADFIGWTAKRGLDEMCEDTWRWQSKNPNGFAKDSKEK
mmetsp:Transcript_19384/g.28689  ORF Transcript_19384/g.28689 Transcript_19384/m.28689 type:complete len:369 (+) Transcript_19384:170-1276(+)